MEVNKALRGRMILKVRFLKIHAKIEPGRPLLDHEAFCSICKMNYVLVNQPGKYNHSDYKLFLLRVLLLEKIRGVPPMGSSHQRTGAT